MNKMIITIEETHKDFICLFKIGNFYHVYGRDSYILSYLFEYKIRNIENNMKECGFPLKSLPKILSKLEDEKINYIVIDSRNNYDVDQKFETGNLNKYKKVYEKSRNYVNYKTRVDNITEFLNKNIMEKDFRKILIKMEELINEERKI